MSTILKELESKKKSTEKYLSSQENKTLALMSSNTAASTSVLKNFGFGEDIEKYEKIKGDSLDREQVEKEYKNKVYLGEELQALCNKYALRCLPTKYYLGKINSQFVEKIIEFATDNNIGIGLKDNDFSGEVENFFILAPVEHFSDDDRVKNNRVNASDAILLYQPSRKNQEFVVVHTWGNSFVVDRILKGWRRKNVSNWYINLAFIISLIIIIGLSFTGLAFLWNLLISIPAALGLSLIGIPWYNGEINNEHSFFTDGVRKKGSYETKPSWKSLSNANGLILFRQ